MEGMPLNTPCCLGKFLLGRGASPVKVFAFEEAEGGDGVGDGEAFGVVVGVDADGLEAAGDGGFGGFDAVAEF